MSLLSIWPFPFFSSIRVFDAKTTPRRSGYGFSSLHTALDPQRTRAERISSYRTETLRYLPPATQSRMKSNLSDSAWRIKTFLSVSQSYSQREAPIVRVLEGPLFSEVVSYHQHFQQTVRIHNVPGIPSILWPSICRS